MINLSSVKIDRRSTDTRQRLIDTTLDLIDSNGWHAVTLSGVARACGVTTPACYKHFPSKTSLFEAAARRLSASLGERADALIQDDPLESLVGIGTLLVDLAAEHPHLFEFNQISPAAIAALDRLDECFWGAQSPERFDFRHDKNGIKQAETKNFQADCDKTGGLEGSE